MNIAEAVKKCALEAFEANVPCDVLFGVVEGVNPCKIRVGDALLEGEILIIGEHLIRKECEITLGVYERTIVINEGMKKGERVILLRGHGGEKYVVIGKESEG